MKYKCIPCDHEFEAKAGTKPRCPRCLKIHDVEPLQEAKKNGPPKRNRSALAPLGVLLTAGIVAVAYFAVKNDNAKDAGKTVDAKNIFEKLAIPKEEAVRPCVPTKGVAAFAETFAEGRTGEAALETLFAGINTLKDQNRWTPYHQREPKEERPLTADKLAKRLLEEKKTPFVATSYELACLLAAAARTLDTDAKMVEVLSFKGEKHPADPPGKLGRYAVALDIEPGNTKEVPVFDLFGNRSKTAALAHVRVLDDVTEMAPYFGIGALSLLVKQEMSEALALNDIAIKLDKDNPYFRAGRGFIFAATGVPSESLVEFEKAVKFRPDPVQRANLAEILLLINPMDKRAETEIQAALKDMPDFARAHALKGMIHLVRDEKDQAETELTLAERLDPKSPAIAMYWARYYAVTMNSEEAVAKAKKAVALSGDSVSMLLGLAGVYREVAEFDAMRATLDKILAKIDTPQMAEQIKQIFGYEPKDETASKEGADTDAPADDGASSSNFELKLGDGLGKKEGPGFGKKSPGLGDKRGGGLDLNMNLDEPTL